MHCRKMEMVPGVPRHVLVSYISEPSIIARLKEYLMVNQSIISLCSIFFWDTLYSEAELLQFVDKMKQNAKILRKTLNMKVDPSRSLII